MTQDQPITRWLDKYDYYYLPSIDPLRLKDEPGNYLFTLNRNGVWVLIYAGCTPNGGTLRQRLPGHEKLEAALAMGPLWVWAHTETNQASMCAEEREIVAALNPVLNVQHRTIPNVLGGRRGGLGS